MNWFYVTVPGSAHGRISAQQTHRWCHRHIQVHCQIHPESRTESDGVFSSLDSTHISREDDEAQVILLKICGSAVWWNVVLIFIIRFGRLIRAWAPILQLIWSGRIRNLGEPERTLKCFWSAQTERWDSFFSAVCVSVCVICPGSVVMCDCCTGGGSEEHSVQNCSRARGWWRWRGWSHRGASLSPPGLTSEISFLWCGVVSLKVLKCVVFLQGNPQTAKRGCTIMWWTSTPPDPTRPDLNHVFLFTEWDLFCFLPLFDSFETFCVWIVVYRFQLNEANGSLV